MRKETWIKRMNEHIEEGGKAFKILMKHMLKDVELGTIMQRRIVYRSYDKILNAMEEYAKLSEQQTTDKSQDQLQNEALIIGDVSKQHELLIAFMRWEKNDDLLYERTIQRNADEFLKSIL